MAVIHHIDVQSSDLENLFKESPDRARITPVRFRCTMLLASLMLFCVTASVCRAQTKDVVCNAGDGNFEASFHTGVKVRVGAARNGELATRACEASLSWNKQKLVIASDTAKIDVDAFGIDLGMGVPVVTIQLKQSDADCCMSYQIYSLEKPARLLRTITGGDFFSAADTDLDGRVEIWTGDSGSVNGFENLDVKQLDFAPAIVLRFAKGQLLDVSSEFQSCFDQKIAKLRAELDSQELRDFKNSDSRLAPTDPSLRRLGSSDHLQRVKLKVLEIIWSYVYSGREQEAWRSLADMWPAADVDRIRAAILTARARGIRAQVDGVSTAVSTGRKEHATIFDGIRTQGGGVPAGVPTGPKGRPGTFGGMANTETNKPELVLPEPIQVWLPPSMGASDQVVLDLEIDSAGKVRSAEPADRTKSVDADLLNVTAEWRFIPAFKDGRAVASRIRVPVSLKR